MIRAGVQQISFMGYQNKTFLARQIIKKTALVLCISATVLLCGCGSRPDAPATDAPDIFQGSGTFSKAQKITAIPSDTEKTDRTICENKEIDAFISEIPPENWEIEAVPENAEETGTFQFTQEETRKPGQSEKNVRMQTICEITVYDIPYITLQLSKPFHLSFSFKISPEAADYLNEYF